MKTANVGDRVAYSANFLRSIGCYAGDMPHARGTITEVTVLGSKTLLARIRWDQGFDMPERVNVANLARVGTSAMCAQ